MKSPGNPLPRFVLLSGILPILPPTKLAKKLKDRKELGNPASLVFYLAIPPQLVK